jgi:hypothetical protein
MLKLLSFILIFFSLVSCKTENPNPELLDPIYKDLVKEANNYKKQYEEQKKILEGLNKDLEKTTPRSLEKKLVLRDLKKVKPLIPKYRQLADFYSIRAKRRKIVARQAYREAFQQDKDWPDPEEYESYLVQKRLRAVNLNWGARVPKLKDRINFGENED